MDIEMERMHANAGNGTYYPVDGYELIYSGANADLPEHRLLHHLYVIFYEETRKQC